MARIPKSNLRYRTKEQISEDVAAVFSSSLSHGTKHAVLAEAVWVWSEFHGKYEGCPFWPASARRSVNLKELCHEHVVPKRYILEKLFSLSSPTTEEVYRVLSTYCIGAVVTRDEDRRLAKMGLRSKMPTNWDEKNIWARYDLAEIEMEGVAEI